MSERADSPKRALWQHPGLWLALAVYLLLALSYFFIVPIFEAPDEWTHTGHIKYIAEGNGLPVMLPGRGIWGGQQPPLYYAIGALLVQPFDLDDFDGYLERTLNPHASAGYALDPGNKNNYLHDSDENFPYRGLSLTVHVLRLYSMAWGVVALIFIYLTALEIFDFRGVSQNLGIWDTPGGIRRDTPRTPQSVPTPAQRTGRRWKIWDRLDFRFSIFATSTANAAHQRTPPAAQLFAASVALFVATEPMFNFITASVANEPANIATGAVAVWLAQRYVLRGPSPTVWRAVTLGAALGLAALAKMTGLAVGLVAVVAFLQTAIAYRRQPGAARQLWRDGLLIGLIFLLVAGWWYWRNFQLYGDFFQRGLYKLYFNVDPQPLTLSQFIYTLRTGEVSFWATFGWLNIVAPEWVYSIYRLISRIGLAGVVLAVLAGVWRSGFRSQEPGIRSHKPGNSQLTIHNSKFKILFHPLILHLVFPLALAFSLTRLVATEGGMQGRQLLPALGSIALVVMWGWWVLLPAKVRLPLLGVLLAGLFGLALWLPLGLVAGQYTPSSPLTEADLPANITRLNWTYKDQLKLLGVQLGAEVVRPGERVPVTVYWQALQPMAINYSVFVHLIGRDYKTVGQFNTYPGLGLHPTTTLKSGQVVADTYPVQVEGGSEAPTRLLVNVGLFNFNEAGRPGIPAIAPDGHEVPSTVATLKLVPVQWPPASPGPPLAEFADQIVLGRSRLEGCTQRGDACVLWLEWQPQGHPSTDYTVFVQLWQDGQPVTGFDSPPLGGDYPTSLWAAGEVIIDPHRLDLSRLPPGDYQLLTGLYNFASGERLPAFSNGQPLPDFAIDLDRISVN